jgi:putative redox protein
MSENTRSVELRRLGFSSFEATNVRGGTMVVGEGNTADFTPVELLLAAVGGCSAIDVDYLTARRAEPESFEVSTTAEKIRDAEGRNRLTEVVVSFRITFPAGADGDRAREMLPRAIQLSHDRICTVSQTVQLPTEVTNVQA